MVGEDAEHHIAGDHGDHATDVQVTTRNALVQDRVQRSHNQACDQCDHAGEGVCGLVVEDELEQEDQHAGGGHVGDGVQQVAQGNPQQLVVLEDGLEGFDRVAVLLGLGTQGALVLLGAEGNGPCGQEAKQADDNTEAGPAGLAFGVLTGEHPAEVGDDRDDHDGDAVVADGAGEGAECGVGGALVGVGAQCRDHTPVGDVTQGVEHVEHDEGDDEQYDEPRGVHVHQAEQAGVH